jgi:hypothetical protein
MIDRQKISRFFRKSRREFSSCSGIFGYSICTAGPARQTAVRPQVRCQPGSNIFDKTDVRMLPVEWLRRWVLVASRAGFLQGKDRDIDRFQ